MSDCAYARECVQRRRYQVRFKEICRLLMHIMKLAEEKETRENKGTSLLNYIFRAFNEQKETKLIQAI
jgi:hypothetical protein